MSATTGSENSNPDAKAAGEALTPGPSESASPAGKSGRVSDDLRRRAEEMLRKLGSRRKQPEFADVASLLEELAVHQVELDLQSQELARANEKLSVAHQAALEYFRHAPLPIFRMNYDGHVLEANLAALDLLGQPPLKAPLALQRAFHAIMPLSSRAVWLEFLETLRTHFEPQTTELVLEPKKEESRYFLATGLHLPRQELVLYLQDITATRKHAEEFERLSLIARYSKSAVIFTDVDRRITWVNPAFTKMTGYTAQEALGKSPDFLQGKETDRATIERMRDCLNRGQGFCEEVLNYTKDGRPYWVKIEVQPHRDKNGELIGFFSIQTDITEIRARENDLSAFRTVIEQTPSPVVMTDLNARITYVNNAFTTTTGYSANEVLGKNPRILKSGRQSPEIYRSLWQKITSGQVWQGVFNNRRKDGSTYWEFATISAFKDCNGKPAGYIAVKQDITHEKETELGLENINRSLERTRRHLEQTNALAMVGSWEADPMTGLMELTPIARRIHEIDDITPLTLEEHLTYFPDAGARERLSQAIENAIQHGLPFDEEAEFLTARGNRRYVRTVGLSEFDNNGQCIRIYGSIQDITGHKELQKQLEQALEKERRQLRFIEDLTNAIPVAIFQRDLEGRILMVNPAAVALTGYSQEDLCRMSIAERDGPEIAAIVEAEDEALISGKATIIRAERHIVHRSGRHVPVFLSKAPIHDAQGRIVGLVAALVDATETKELEKELRRAKHDAEAASRAKSAFLATMSHEIRTPLNAVIGMASLLAESELSAEQREYVSTIVNASETLLDLINDILDYSKIESQKLELHKEPFCFEDLLLEPIELLARAAAQKGLELVYEVDGRIPAHLIGDRARLKQILLNLLANAVKFTAAGQVSVGVHLEKQTAQNCLLRFEVKDTGIGIPEEALPHLFQPFSQADTSITRQFGGTGLGLAISRQLVHLMNGEIGVKSQPGKGSCFHFTLPLGIPQKQRGAIQDNWQKFAGQLEGRRVLFAEASSPVFSLAKACARMWGLQVRSVTTKDDLLAAFADSKGYDFLVWDADFCGEEGPALAMEILGGRQPLCRYKILAASSPEAQSAFGENLFDEVAGKPLRPSKLSEICEKALSCQDPQPLMTPRAEPKSSSHLRVLVAEDNVNNRTVLQILLKKLGVQAVLCENGKQALERVTKGGPESAFELCILDVQMPVMDGLSAVRQMRAFYHQHPELPRPYFLALTANAFKEDEAACLTAGFDRYLAKPVSLQQLRDVLDEIVAGCGAAVS